MKHAAAVDLLGAPVPSAIPSPDLRPIARQLDLIKFESVAGIYLKSKCFTDCHRDVKLWHIVNQLLFAATSICDSSLIN
jgi:hypothetical protein